MSKNGKAGHLLFVWKTSGYELKEAQGEPPAVGTELEEGEAKFHVTRLGPSPLPGDDRRCAYLQPL